MKRLSRAAGVVLRRKVRAPDGGRIIPFDTNWRFKIGDTPSAEQPQFDDSGWRVLDVPHDWSIEGSSEGLDSERASKMEGPFDPACPGLHDTGYLNGGTAWYRKTFSLPDNAVGKHVILEFDGVYMDSDTWINGVHLGRHPYGYTGFYFDLTPHLKQGRNANLISVRVRATQPCSRWYSGAGIYRRVKLVVKESVNIARCGVHVTTPVVTETDAIVRVRTQVHNEGTKAVTASLKTAIVDESGDKIGEAVATQDMTPGATFEFDFTIKVHKPRRWSIEDPFLFSAASELHVIGRTAADSCVTQFGIRTFEFTADRGFFLNGKHVRLKGVCNHHDLGCLGTAMNRRGIERQLEIMRDMGCNAIRTSHNPPAPELLDLCDRMGFVVMDECFDEWKTSKREYGYGRFFDEWSEADLVSMIRRDRNHPCIIMWSVGNEVPEQEAANGRAMTQRLVDICHREDPTRPVTSACNVPASAVKTGFAAPLDIFGINYNIPDYNTHRGRLIVASETSSAVSTRGEYNLVEKDGQLEIAGQLDNQCSSYDIAFPVCGCEAEADLMALRDAPWVAGEFVWTGFDYIGEPTPFKWPSRSSYFGIADLCGFPKDRYYLYQSQWTKQPMVHILPHWNWEQHVGKQIPVWCFSNCDTVELYLNGKSLGEKSRTDMKSLHFEWSVKYEPGVLTAVAKRAGRIEVTAETRTAGRPSRLVLAADRTRLAADGNDLAFVKVEVVDEDGVVCPNADNLIRFTITGRGVLAGIDNGDPTNHEPFQGSAHKAFHGLCLAVVRTTRMAGSIRLMAKAEGLKGSGISLLSRIR